MKNGIYFTKSLKTNKKNVLLKTFLFISLLKNIINSEIYLIIQGNGTQTFLYNGFNTKPSEVYVNGVKEDNCNDEIKNSKICNLKGDKNNITLKFNKEISSCFLMFFNMLNIIEIDLSNFDFSKVKSLSSMFDGCNNLEKIEFGNIDTSSVITMTQMFQSCSKLKSIDLSKFDTSKVVDMCYMFNYCSSLEKIEFGNINTSSVEYMYDMFHECHELTSIDLSKFNTSKVTKMTSMFYNCNKLKYLDLSNFDTSNVKTIKKMFYNCTSLIYLNLKNFQLNNSVIKIDTFYNIFSNINICIENEKVKNILNLTFSDCSNDCFKDNVTIDFENNKCIGTCSKYEYNNICYNECPKDTYSLFCDNDNNCEINLRRCFDNAPIGYYFDKQNKIYKKYPKENELINKNCTRNNPFLLINECVFNCSIIERQNKVCITRYFNDTDKDFYSFDIIIEQIRYELTNIFDNSVIDGDIINEKDFNVTITRTDNQKDIIINFGQCEERLKSIYNINQNESLYLLKFDIEQDGMCNPSIAYELYYPINGINLEKLNLSECEGMEINITYHLNITGNLDKYNSSSDYYNDICYTTDSEYNTDITISDRKNDYINDNMSSCQINCKFISYNYETKKVVCSCGVQTKIPLIKDIKFDKELLLKSFININDFAHIKMLKCYKTIFKKKKLRKNIGFFIYSGFILLNLIFLFIFCLKYFDVLKNDIKIFKFKILNRAANDIIKTDTINQNKNNNKIYNNFSNKSNKSKKKKNNYSENFTEMKSNNKEMKKIRNNIFTEVPRQSKKKIRKKNIKRTKNSLSFNSNVNLGDTKATSFNLTNNKKKVKIELNDSELNDLNYEEAIIKDKRTCIQYYISLLKINHSVIFIFNNDDYNSKIIKLSIFIFNLSSLITINALFFTDSSMHKIYMDKGIFDIIYQLPQIIYSSLISQLLNYLIQILGFSEDNILQLKKGSIKNINIREKKTINKLRKKFVFFYIIDFILIIVFWYYTTCFCDVYKNTQIPLFKDCLISFLTSLVTPFIIYLFPGLLRICALKNKNKYFFGISKIFQFF